MHGFVRMGSQAALVWPNARALGRGEAVGAPHHSLLSGECLHTRPMGDAWGGKGGASFSTSAVSPQRVRVEMLICGSRGYLTQRE